jgi:hypothetical protein
MNFKLFIMEHNWNLEELHVIKANINKEIEAIRKAHLNELYQQLNTVEHLIKEYKDGYIYWVCIRSYGSQRWREYNNRQAINELVNEYGDGYDGLVDIYSNNPRLLNKVGEDTYMCDTYYTLDDLPEDKREKYAGSPFSAGVTLAVEAMLGKGE